MRTTFLCLAVMFIVPHINAAPAPAPGHEAKEKLEVLKKRLPSVLNDWVTEDNVNWLINPPFSEIKRACKPELRVLRRVGTFRAKAVILFAAYEKKERLPHQDVVVTVYLTYQDGRWTTETFEASSRAVDSTKLRSAFAFLMLAIDEAAEKP